MSMCPEGQKLSLFVYRTEIICRINYFQPKYLIVIDNEDICTKRQNQFSSTNFCSRGGSLLSCSIPHRFIFEISNKKKQIDEARLTIDRFVCFKQLKLLIIILMTHTPQVRRNYKKQEFKIRNNFFYLFSHIE